MKSKKETPLTEKNIADLVKTEGCFDLQFRRDVKHDRLNQPIYYNWKTQFVIVMGYKDDEILQKIRDNFNCGKIHYATKNQARYSVQNIDDLYNVIVSFFEKYPLSGKKKKDFDLWAEAVEIIYRNKRKTINIEKGVRGFTKSNWNKEDFRRLIEIQKLMQKYKTKRPQGFKWISVAESIAEGLSGSLNPP